jgi:hypothetical protein
MEYIRVRFDPSDIRDVIASGNDIEKRLAAPKPSS